MTYSAILKAARDVIRTHLSAAPFSFLSAEIQVCPSGRPRPNAGERFIAIHGAEWANANPKMNTGLDERYGFDVTYTFRVGKIPYDRWQEAIYLDTTESMELVMARIIRCFSGANVYDDFLPAANAYITDNSNKIVEAPFWSSCDPAPKEVESDWFEGVLSPGTLVETTAGLVWTASIRGVRRIQGRANVELST